MASLVLTRTPHRAYRIPYRHQPPPRTAHRVTYLVDHAPRYDASGIDNCRFYRIRDEILVLVLGTNRGTDVGFTGLSEPWEPVSGVFALPNTRRHPEEKNICIRKMESVWVEFRDRSPGSFNVGMNLALNQAGYQQADGSAIS